MNLFRKIKRFTWYSLVNTLGWHTNRKLVVIESDDWGSIRMPSREVYNYLLKKGINVNKSPFDRFDSLENNEDLEALFEVLMYVKDTNNHPAIITANSVVANPNFDSIKASNYKAYHYELFYETLNKYNNYTGGLEQWKEGLEKGIFVPQFHGREHYNIPNLMNALRNGDKEVCSMFDLGIAGAFHLENLQHSNPFLIAYSNNSQDDLFFFENSIKEGLSIFEKIWGYPSKSFIAPCYTWSNEIELTLKLMNIDLIQGVSFQHVPQFAMKDKRIFHYSGEENGFGQRYNVRNCFFEPALNPNFDWVSSCMNQIQYAFLWRKPAVICSHRLNYIGSIDPSNRSKNLILLKDLLVGIMKKWPDVEFVSSDKLIERLD